MNRADIEFSVHDSDLKAGSGTPGSITPTTCSDALYAESLKYFNSLEKPAIFTPGDNDWTDCDRAANAGFNSLERLDHECLSMSGPAPCVENRRWTFHGVTYATFNVPGSCNNLCDTNPDPNEYAVRNAADMGWVQQTFAAAEARGSSAVMLISQADPDFDVTDLTARGYAIRRRWWQQPVVRVILWHPSRLWTGLPGPSRLATAATSPPPSCRMRSARARRNGPHVSLVRSHHRCVHAMLPAHSQQTTHRRRPGR